MLYAGLDSHKSFSYITTMDDKGQIVAQKKVTERMMPVKRKRDTNNLAASSGTLPYIARRETQTIVHLKNNE